MLRLVSYSLGSEGEGSVDAEMKAIRQRAQQERVPVCYTSLKLPPRFDSQCYDVMSLQLTNLQVCV